MVNGMITVDMLMRSLMDLPPDMPVVVIDSRSGVVEGPSTAIRYQWHERDNNYGLDLPVGTEVAAIHLG